MFNVAYYLVSRLEFLSPHEGRGPAFKLTFAPQFDPQAFKQGRNDTVTNATEELEITYYGEAARSIPIGAMYKFVPMMQNEEVSASTNPDNITLTPNSD